MTIIINEIDKINDSYERIKYSKLIPCNCSTCTHNPQAHFYRLQELKERVAYQQEYIGCGKPPFHQVKVLELIDDTIGRQNLDNKKVNKNKNQTNSVNFAGSSIGQVIFKQGDDKMDDRKININEGNYNENISTTSDTDRPKKRIVLGFIISILAIIIPVFASGIFNEPIKEFFNLNSPSETPEQLEKTPTN